MTQDTSVDRTIARIRAITWEPNNFRAASHIALFKEYLRRASLWANALNCTDRWPLFDVAAEIDLSFRADEAKVEALNRHVTSFRIPRTMKRTCEWFVHWAGVKHRLEVTKMALPDPYDPLMLLYERGGDFYFEQGLFHFSVGGFPRGTWSDHYSLSPHILLDEHVLDQLDTREGTNV